MNKIVKKVMAKLNEQKEISNLVNILDNARIYREPRNIIRILQEFYNENKLSTQEALNLMGKIQQAGIITKSMKAHKDAEKAWRLLLKEWKIPSFRLERGAF